MEPCGKVTHFPCHLLIFLTNSHFIMSGLALALQSLYMLTSNKIDKYSAREFCRFLLITFYFLFCDTNICLLTFVW